MSACATAAPHRALPLAQRHGLNRPGQQRPLSACLPRVWRPVRRHGVQCSAHLNQGPASSSAEAASRLAAPVQDSQQPAAHKQQEAGERWMPASWLSGWQATPTLLLSLGAVSGGGLLGAAAMRRLQMHGRCCTAASARQFSFAPRSRAAGKDVMAFACMPSLLKMMLRASCTNPSHPTIPCPGRLWL